MTLRSLTNRGRALATALAAVAVAVALAAPAQAQPVKPTPSKSCPVEDEHGNVTYVQPGTQIGLFHCGSDGEWHFGWATTDRAILPPPVA